MLVLISCSRALTGASGGMCGLSHTGGRSAVWRGRSLAFGRGMTLVSFPESPV